MIRFPNSPPSVVAGEFSADEFRSMRGPMWPKVILVTMMYVAIFQLRSVVSLPPQDPRNTGIANSPPLHNRPFDRIDDQLYARVLGAMDTSQVGDILDWGSGIGVDGPEWPERLSEVPNADLPELWVSERFRFRSWIEPGAVPVIRTSPIQFSKAILWRKWIDSAEPNRWIAVGFCLLKYADGTRPGIHQVIAKRKGGF